MTFIIVVSYDVGYYYFLAILVIGKHVTKLKFRLIKRKQKNKTVITRTSPALQSVHRYPSIWRGLAI